MSSISIIFLVTFLSFGSIVASEDCRWIGHEPFCGNANCGDGWYVQGTTTVDEDGTPCTTGVRTYCCPVARTPGSIRVKLCSGKYLQADCFDIHEYRTECVRYLSANLNRKVNSVDIFGGCVRLYDNADCEGTTIAFHSGNSNHDDLSKWDFANRTRSVGPCLRNDFCTPQGKCRFPAEKFIVGWNPNATREYTRGVVRQYEHGLHSSRTQFVYAKINSGHLDTGTQPEIGLQEYVRFRGQKSDVVGQVVSGRIGGIGSDHRNLYPLNSDPNTLLSIKVYQNIIYDVIQKHGEVVFRGNLQYRNETDTRPFQLVFCIKDKIDTHVLFLDSVPNPTILFDSFNSVAKTDQHKSIIESRPTASNFNRSKTNELTTNTTETEYISIAIIRNVSTLSPIVSETDQSIEIQDNRTAGLLYYVLLAVIVTLLLVMFAYGFWKLKNRNAGPSPKSTTELAVIHLEESRKLEPKVLFSNRNHKAGLPPDQKCVIPKSSIYIDRACTLGQGEFGTIYRGSLKQGQGHREVTAVIAVKVLKDSVSQEHRDALLAELGVLSSIGRHENIVHFYGFMAEDYINGDLLIVMELCEKGSLQKLLRESGDKARTVFSDQQEIDLNYDLEGTYVFLDLVGFSVQFACAMEYLENKKVIHGDLATRNLLVTDAGSLKVSDFGLSKQLLNYDIYVKTSKGPLPWRWMSPESLERRCFSIKSDVWSFGVTLWEIFSYANIPFFGLRWTSDFARQLQTEECTLSKPRFASIEIYRIMKKCMRVDPDRRPNFHEIHSDLKIVRSAFKAC